MIKKTFKKEDWAKALEGLEGDFKVFVPVKEGDFHNFRLLEDGRKPNFEFQNTRLSPKSVILPQSERMFEYTLDESKGEAHVVKEAHKDFSPQVIVGIRPCDAFAFQLVRINFDNPNTRILGGFSAWSPPPLSASDATTLAPPASALLWEAVPSARKGWMLSWSIWAIASW